MMINKWKILYKVCKTCGKHYRPDFKGVLCPKHRRLFAIAQYTKEEQKRRSTRYKANKKLELKRNKAWVKANRERRNRSARDYWRRTHNVKVKDFRIKDYPGPSK